MNSIGCSLSLSPVFSLREPASAQALDRWRESLREAGKKLVFTNGVFDLVHAGHVTYLAAAQSLGDALIIGLNSDASVHRIKGPKRPLQGENDRAMLLSALRSVDAVAIFDQDTPLELITRLVPDVLVKGGDWSVENIVGREIVENAGGKVLPLPFVEGRSTTNIVERVIERYTATDQ